MALGLVASLINLNMIVLILVLLAEPSACRMKVTRMDQIFLPGYRLGCWLIKPLKGGENEHIGNR